MFLLSLIFDQKPKVSHKHLIQLVVLQPYDLCLLTAALPLKLGEHTLGLDYSYFVKFGVESDLELK